MGDRLLWLKAAWSITRFQPRKTRLLHFIDWWINRGGHGGLYKLARFIEGARHIETADYAGTGGEYISGEPFAIIEFGGACPVQGEGHVMEYPCYYRSRGEGWQFHVAATKDGDPLDDDAFEYYENPYYWPEGGWVPTEVSFRCIERGINKWADSPYRGVNG